MRSLNRELWASKGGRFHVEQGQAGHRAGENPLSGNLSQSGHDHHFDVLAFKCPAEAPEAAGVKPRGRGAGDGVDPYPLCDVGGL